MDEPRYHAFLSYSHEADRATAIALQEGLQRFGKPWYRVRALRIFRDDASLAAEPQLWPAIERALAESGHFILLASPEAARSPWVEREVRFWCEHKPLERLLTVLTDGDLASTAASPALAEALREEPRFVDLRWARRGGELDLREPRFQSAIADLAAPLHGRSKDELIGEDIRAHRRAVGIARAVVTTITLLALVAAAAAFVALDQRQDARAQRDRAERQATLATSRLLAETADEQRAVRLDRALLLAAAASELAPTPEAAGALLDGIASADSARLFIAEPRSSAAAIDAQGTLVAIGHEDGRVRLHTVARPSTVRAVHAEPGAPVTAVAFSSDARLVAWGRKDGLIAVARVRDGQVLMSGTGGRGEIQALAFTPDGRALASAPQWKPVDVWSVDGRLLRSLRPRTDVIETWLAFTANDRLVRTTDAGTTTVWDGWREDPRFSLGGDDVFDSPKETVEGVLAASGDAVITQGTDGPRRLWRPTAEGWRWAATSVGGSLIALADGGGQAAATSDDGTVRIWSTEAEAESGPALRAFRAGFPSATFSAHGDLLLTIDPGAGAVVWSTAPRSPLLIEALETPSTSTDGLRPMGRDAFQLAYDSERGIYLSTVQAGAAEAREVIPLEEFVNDLEVSEDGTTVAAADTFGVVHVRRADGTERRFNLGRYGPSQDIALTRNGDLVAVTAVNSNGPGTTVIWDVATGAERARVRALEGEDDALAFSKDGRTLAAGAEAGPIRLIDPRTGEVRSTLGKNENLTYELAFSPDGRLLASAHSDGRVQLWDVRRRRAFGDALVGHEGQVSAVAFSRNGQMLASGGFDKRVLLWDVPSRQRIGQIGMHGVLVDQLAFSEDGRRLASTAGDEFRVWNTDRLSWRRRACEIANRELTRTEWEQNAGDLPYRSVCTPR